MSGNEESKLCISVSVPRQNGVVHVKKKNQGRYTEGIKYIIQKKTLLEKKAEMECSLFLLH